MSIMYQVIISTFYHGSGTFIFMLPGFDGNVIVRLLGLLRWGRWARSRGQILQAPGGAQLTFL